MFPIAILVSGNGTNLQAIIDAIEAGKLNAEIKVVISDNPDAHALARCSKHGIQSVIHQYPSKVEASEHLALPVRARGVWGEGASQRASRSPHSKDAFEGAIAQTVVKNGAELICLAGFMRVLSPKFVSQFRGKIINIHPALLPSFPGLHAQKQALDHGAKVSGCTVHFVNEGVDAGPIILQSAVPVMPDDTEETLSKRILEKEHELYPKAIKLFAEGKLKVSGRRVSLIPSDNK